MRTTTIDHDGLSLGLLVAGDNRKPGLVLLHGWPHSSRVFDQVIDPLAETFFVLAFDLPNIGMSHGAARSAEKTVLADILLGAAERIGARSILMAGLDVGGMIAFAAARDHGHRIRGAAVINTVVPGIEPWSANVADPRIWHFAFHAIPALPERLVAGQQRAYFDYFADVLAGNRSAVTDAHRTAFAEAYERPEALKAGFDLYRAMAADARHNAQRMEIRTPLRVLRGDADGRSPAPYADGLTRIGALNVTAEALHGSGEFAPLETPTSFMSAIEAFADACSNIPAHGPQAGANGSRVEHW